MTLPRSSSAGEEGEQIDRLAEEVEAVAALLNEPRGADPGAQRARRAPAAGQLDLLPGESSRIVFVAPGTQEERGRRAPRRVARVMHAEGPPGAHRLRAGPLALGPRPGGNPWTSADLLPRRGLVGRERFVSHIGIAEQAKRLGELAALGERLGQVADGASVPASGSVERSDRSSGRC